jgi:hypothetical protein
MVAEVALYGPMAVCAPRFPLHYHTIWNVSQSATYCGLVRPFRQSLNP